MMWTMDMVALGTALPPIMAEWLSCKMQSARAGQHSHLIFAVCHTLWHSMVTITFLHGTLLGKHCCTVLCCIAPVSRVIDYGKLRLAID